ncbi:MAG: hypothetical protein U0Q16_30010 [Bryobacteraceae bacterium]
MRWIDLALVAAAVYLIAGLLFGVAFAIRGAGAIDPQAHGAPWSFRLIITPGVAIFWPLLLRRWLRGESGVPMEANEHRRAARVRP